MYNVELLCITAQFNVLWGLSCAKSGIVCCYIALLLVSHNKDN